MGRISFSASQARKAALVILIDMMKVVTRRCRCVRREVWDNDVGATLASRGGLSHSEERDCETHA